MTAQKRPADSDMASSRVKVSVKWGKETFSDVEVDLDSPPLVFKAQLFALTSVQPDRCLVCAEPADPDQISIPDAHAVHTSCPSPWHIPPRRQKVMIKGALLKDDEWGKAQPKEGALIMLMGSAEARLVEPPKEAHVFVEDLPEHEQVLGRSCTGREPLLYSGDRSPSLAPTTAMQSVQAVPKTSSAHARHMSHAWDLKTTAIVWP